jgi:Tol biopolymer transport system component
VTVAAPPRPPRPSDPVDREELEALVEALIEEARKRQQRRRRRNAAVVTLVALLGGALFTVFARGAASTKASPTLPQRSSLAAGAASPKIAFIRRVWAPLKRFDEFSELYVVNADGSGKRKLAQTGHSPIPPAWSPDGRKLAFTSTFRGNKEGEIFVINADGSGLRRLTRNSVGDYQPAWSPDGQKIAWVRVRHDTWSDIFVMNADGSDQRHLTRMPGYAGQPDWSPDGQTILFTEEQAGQPTTGSPPYSDVYVINADGSGLRNLTRTPKTTEFEAVWSPDGQHIAFNTPDGTVGTCRVFVMNADGSGKHAVTPKIGGDLIPSWSPDGRKLAFWNHGAIYLVNTNGTGQRRLASYAALARPSWSPDGQKLTFVRRHNAKKLPIEGDWPPPPSWTPSDLWVINADGSGQHNLTRTHDPTASDGWGATWAR